MIGGLFKSASRLALVAAAGMFASGVAPATAADLGGDCCADLEERVALLESTTVRKGNNKVSLKLSGQVNRQFMWYDDGRESKWRSLENHNSSSRITLDGSAKISPKITAGYSIEFEIEGGGTSNKVNQFQPNDSAVAEPTTDSLFDVRLSAWYLDHPTYGKITVGRWHLSGNSSYGVDLAGIQGTAAASALGQNLPAGMLLRKKGGELLASAAGGGTGLTWNLFGATTMNGARAQEIRYDSPTIMGVIFSAAYADDESWGVDLRWAQEWMGFRLAATVGYNQYGDEIQAAALASNVTGSFGNGAGQGGNPYFLNQGLHNGNRDDKQLQFGAAAMHIQSGLFVQGGYQKYWYGGTQGGLQSGDFACAGSAFAAGGCTGANITTGTLARSASGSIDAFGDNRAPRSNWHIQAGISQNWFGLGKTVLFGEYHQSNNFGVGINLAPNSAGANAEAAWTMQLFGNNSVPANGTRWTVSMATSTQLNVWGLGMVQNIDAAAMELYLGYRHYELQMTGCNVSYTNGDNNTSNAARLHGREKCESSVQKAKIDGGFDTVMTGARIKF